MEVSRDENALMGAAGMNMGDPNAGEDYDGPRVQYVCGGKYLSSHWQDDGGLDCGKESALDNNAHVRCFHCNHRIFYKKRERKLLQYEARWTRKLDLDF